MAKRKIAFTAEGGFYEYSVMRLVDIEPGHINIWPGSSFPGGWQLTYRSFIGIKVYHGCVELTIYKPFRLTWSKYGRDLPQVYVTHRLCIIQFLWWKLWLHLGEIKRRTHASAEGYTGR